MLAKVNADEEKKLAQDYEVTGYPTLKVFRQGKASDYKGPRNQWGKLIIYTFCASFSFLPHFDVICDLLVNRHRKMVMSVFKPIGPPSWSLSPFPCFI